MNSIYSIKKSWLQITLGCAFLLMCTNANSAQRIALVIGNGAYSTVGALPNPPADAELIASTLENLGFDTTLAVDSNQLEMKRAIAEFGRSLRSAERNAVGFFYYAGHGIQARGRNYLLPIEATPTDETDLDLMGVEANWVLRQMESAGNRTNIIVLDACRNNPFVSANRSLSRGLAQIDAPTGSFISYATAPGKIALDGSGENSPFTLALVKALPKQGIPIEQVFKSVRVDVIKATKGGQIPWDSSSLIEDFYMTPDNKSVENPTTAERSDQISTDELLKEPITKAESQVPAKPAPDEFTLFERAATERNIEDLELYAQLFPNGQFIALVQAEIANIQKTTNTPKPLTDDTTNNIAADASSDITTDTGESSTKQLPENITFEDTLGFGVILEGESLSILQLTRRSPVYPPIVGLEESYWKNVTCSNCHSWDKATLCTQGEFFVGTNDHALSRIEHPYGGKFKTAIRSWAESGCN